MSFGVGVVDICAVVRDVCPTLEEDEVVVLPEGEVSSGTLVEALCVLGAEEGIDVLASVMMLVCDPPVVLALSVWWSREDAAVS